jgi:hypothetical protein
MSNPIDQKKKLLRLRMKNPPSSKLFFKSLQLQQRRKTKLST